MPRAKKSRKIGQIGARKETSLGQVNDKHQKRKPSKGRPAGSRHNTDEKPTTRKSSPTSTDPRLGSKKPVSLTPVEKQKKYATPQHELDAIESDWKLHNLLDRMEQGHTLTRFQMKYVEDKTARHAVLSSLLGIAQETEDRDSQPENDPYASLDAISMQDFTDSE